MLEGWLQLSALKERSLKQYTDECFKRGFQELVSDLQDIPSGKSGPFTAPTHASHGSCQRIVTMSVGEI